MIEIDRCKKEFLVSLAYLLLLSLTMTSVKAEEGWPQGSALQEATLLSEEAHGYEKKTDALMRTIYTKINDKTLNEDIKAQITAWHQYKKAVCALIGTSTGAGGSWPVAHTVRCEKGLSYDRYFATKNALQCINRLEKQKYISPHEKIDCLKQTFNIKLF
jgi:hypothetical protein